MGSDDVSDYDSDDSDDSDDDSHWASNAGNTPVTSACLNFRLLARVPTCCTDSWAASSSLSHEGMSRRVTSAAGKGATTKPRRRYNGRILVHCSILRAFRAEPFSSVAVELAVAQLPSCCGSLFSLRRFLLRCSPSIAG